MAFHPTQLQRTFDLRWPSFVFKLKDTRGTRARFLHAFRSFFSMLLSMSSTIRLDLLCPLPPRGRRRRPSVHLLGTDLVASACQRRPGCGRSGCGEGWLGVFGTRSNAEVWTWSFGVCSRAPSRPTLVRCWWWWWFWQVGSDCRQAGQPPSGPKLNT